MEGYSNVKKWLNQRIISHIIVPLLSGYSEDFSRDMLDKLGKNGFKN